MYGNTWLLNSSGEIIPASYSEGNGVYANLGNNISDAVSMFQISFGDANNNLLRPTTESCIFCIKY